MRGVDSGPDISRYLVASGLRPVPAALLLGRGAALRVVIGAKYLFSFTTGEN